MLPDKKTSATGGLAFVLDNFRLMHTEQCNAIADTLGSSAVLGIELFASSSEYPLLGIATPRFEKVTLFAGNRRGQVGAVVLMWCIVRKCLARDVRTIFMSHYERPYIFLAALVLRMAGRRLIVVNDSKFDDYPRFLWREIFKRMLHLPYWGGLAASSRCADYLRFLGISADRIRLHAYTADIERLRRDAGTAPAPEGAAHAERSFVCVARLVEKKNHRMLLDAYARYADRVVAPRPLELCGSGPLEAEIRAQVSALGLGEWVIMHGNIDATQVSAVLARGMCLVLPSKEEQFGIVVLEAQAMGLPVLVSLAAGARDEQVRTGVNGFVVESDNTEGLAAFMVQLHSDEPLWRAMAIAAQTAARGGDTTAFAASVLSLAA